MMVLDALGSLRQFLTKLLCQRRGIAKFELVDVDAARKTHGHRNSLCLTYRVKSSTVTVIQGEDNAAPHAALRYLELTTRTSVASLWIFDSLRTVQ
jgi:hypothetical protein